MIKMEYKIYKLAFQGEVHFGKQRLERCEYTFCADTLFSALCHETIKMGENTLDKLYTMVKEGRILFSDAFPYIGNTYFLPKPMKRIEVVENRGDSSDKKRFKKLKYIQASDFEAYLSGNYDIKNAVSMDDLGKFNMKVSAAIRGEEVTMPYRVATFSFNENNGVYVIIGYKEKEDLFFIEEIFENLMFSGIGGKRTAGLGRFELETARNFPTDILKRLNSDGSMYMTLSVSLPKNDELENALNGAEYLLGKRSGFVSSDTYAKSQRKKNDLYVMLAGSCVKNKYEGDIYDVSEKGMGHQVYRYAKPLFMEVGQ